MISKFLAEVKEIMSHVNEIQKLGKEKQELERLQQAWTDSLYGWQAAKRYAGGCGN